MKQRNQMARLCLGAVIAALYTVLTLALPVLSFGPIQFRLAEGMTVLAWLCPEAIPGLTLGCFLSNLIGSPYALDWIMGTLATLIAALWTAHVPKRWMAPIPPVLCNMVIVGAEIAWFETNGFGSAFFAAWAWTHRRHWRSGRLRPGGDAAAAGAAPHPRSAQSDAAGATGGNLNDSLSGF